eukprot:TRINITY_DN4101_c0_g1_i2.p1 TRINITY_DN4101_c0_g1~~TRINITY_DN4101_c0_g1_i2.p1  ORF type:complete len:711 (+),score=163.25 TRINITY_DN4101_c0_g1_i2:90-2222(+)
MSGPIPFIIHKEGGLQVTEEAKQFLQSIQRPIGIVTVAGLYRTGKSYVLNKLVGRQDGFRVGSTINACTKGLWIWGAPVEKVFPGQTKGYLLFVDTEGLGSPDATQTYDAQIMSLAILLSSFFIYNSHGTIDQHAVNDLALVLNLAEKIKAQSAASPDAGRDLFPYFLWLLRDFSLLLENPDGSTLSPNEYLEQSLKILPEKTGGAGNQHSNEMRRKIVDTFSNRSCITLPRPTNEERDLQKLASLPDQVLREGFRKGIEELKSKVYSLTQLKSFYGKPLNGNMLFKLSTEYVQLINKGAIPVIASAWESVMLAECISSFEDCLRFYTSEMEGAIQKAVNGLEENHLQLIHQQYSSAALEKYRTRITSSGNHEEAYFSKLTAEIQSLYKKYHAANSQSSKEKCVAYLVQIEKDFINPEISKKADITFEEATEFWVGAYEHYHKEAVGPGKYGAFFESVTNRFPRSLSQVHNRIQQLSQRGYEEQVKQLREVQHKIETEKNQLFQEKLQEKDSLLKRLSEQEHEAASARKVMRETQEELLRTKQELTASQGKSTKEKENMTKILQEKDELLHKADRDLMEARQTSQQKHAQAQRQIGELEDLKAQLQDAKSANDAHKQARNKFERDLTEQTRLLVQCQQMLEEKDRQIEAQTRAQSQLRGQAEEILRQEAELKARLAQSQHAYKTLEGGFSSDVNLLCPVDVLELSYAFNL